MATVGRRTVAYQGDDHRNFPRLDHHVPGKQQPQDGQGHDGEDERKFGVHGAYFLSLSLLVLELYGASWK